MPLILQIVEYPSFRWSTLCSFAKTVSSTMPFYIFLRGILLLIF
jgi:hypothetical protein